MSEQIEQQFNALINKAHQDFKKRLEQQRLFQTQDILLKELHKKIKENNYCSSTEMKFLSDQYEIFKNQQKETGRSYNDIIQEKNLVDVYSSFEKFLFDCFYAIYTCFPKFLGETVSNISIVDIFLNEDIELCRKNIIEFQIKSLIQSKNIKEILNTFGNKPFHIKHLDKIEEYKRNKLYEISLIRNLIIHNHGIVNNVHLKLLKKSLSETEIKYQFTIGDSVLTNISIILEDAKNITVQLSQSLTNIIIENTVYLNQRHQNI